MTKKNLPDWRPMFIDPDGVEKILLYIMAEAQETKVTLLDLKEEDISNNIEVLIRTNEMCCIERCMGILEAMHLTGAIQGTDIKRLTRFVCWNVEKEYYTEDFINSQLALIFGDEL